MMKMKCKLEGEIDIVSNNIVIHFDENDYKKFLSVKMIDGKAIIAVTDHALCDGEYNLPIPNTWALPIEGKESL
jgi:hypothetical protein